MNWFRVAHIGQESVIHYVYGYGYNVFANLFSNSKLVSPKSPQPSELWRNRLERVLHHLELGQEVTLCDLDAIPLKNLNTYIDRERGDLISSQGTVFPKTAHNAWGFVLCCGFMVFRPTIASKNLVKRALNYQAEKYTDQLALNNVLLQEQIEWSGFEGTYTVRSMGRAISCSKTTISGTINQGILAGLSVRMLPHEKFRRLPNLVESENPIMFHPLPEKPGAPNVIRRLRELGLWNKARKK